MTEGYHPYVFDPATGELVGLFEEMYQAEEIEGFDSWNQDDVDAERPQACLAMLSHRLWRSALDVGCGKGALTRRIRAQRIIGVDVSETAIAVARQRFPEGDWRVLDRPLADVVGSERFELATAFEVLSYVEEWRRLLAGLAAVAENLCVSLYLPPDPRGFVKSFADLRAGFGAVAHLDREAVVGGGSKLVLLGRSKSAP